jgi:hypothetical protein
MVRECLFVKCSGLVELRLGRIGCRRLLWVGMGIGVPWRVVWFPMSELVWSLCTDSMLNKFWYLSMIRPIRKLALGNAGEHDAGNTCRDNPKVQAPCLAACFFPVYHWRIIKKGRQARLKPPISTSLEKTCSSHTGEFHQRKHANNASPAKANQQDGSPRRDQRA